MIVATVSVAPCTACKDYSTYLCMPQFEEMSATAMVVVKKTSLVIIPPPAPVALWGLAVCHPPPLPSPNISGTSYAYTNGPMLPVQLLGSSSSIVCSVIASSPLVSRTCRVYTAETDLSSADTKSFQTFQHPRTSTIVDMKDLTPSPKTKVFKFFKQSNTKVKELKDLQCTQQIRTDEGDSKPSGISRHKQAAKTLSCPVEATEAEHRQKFKPILTHFKSNPEIGTKYHDYTLFTT